MKDVENCRIYVDDVVVFSETIEEHDEAFKAGKENKIADALSRVTEDTNDSTKVPDQNLTRVIRDLTANSLPWQGLGKVPKS